MNSEARRLREKRAEIHAQATEILNKPSLTADDKRKFDLMMAEVEALKQDIDRLELSEQVDRELRSTVRPPEAAVGDFADLHQSSSERRHSKAFSSYLRVGLQGISEEERSVLFEKRDMGTGGGNALEGSGGGFFVPVGFMNKVEVALKYYGNMFAVSTILDTATGNPLPYPTSDDTSTVGELVGEASSVATADVNISSVLFGAFKFSSKMVKASLELVQDSAFDIDNFLADAFGRRLGRILNTKFTVGGGTSEPTGIITAATASTQTVIGDDNASSPDPTSEVGYLDLVNLEHSVDISYRRGALFMFHDSTLQALKRLKDKYGRPIWQPGVTSGAADTILGYGYSINNDMPELQAGAKAVAFGQLSKYVIRRVRELAVLRLTERFADYGQLAWLAFWRGDGNLLDAGSRPVKYLVMHS